MEKGPTKKDSHSPHKHRSSSAMDRVEEHQHKVFKKICDKAGLHLPLLLTVRDDSSLTRKQGRTTAGSLTPDQIFL